MCVTGMVDSDKNGYLSKEEFLQFCKCGSCCGSKFCGSQRFKPLLNFVKTSSGQQTLHFIDATWSCIAVLFSDDTKPHAVSIIRVSRELMMNLLVMPAACQLVSHYTAVVLSYCCFMPNLLRPNNCAPKSEHISYGRLLLPRQAQVTNQ